MAIASRSATLGSYFARTGQMGTQLVLPRHGPRFWYGPVLRPAGVEVRWTGAGASSASTVPSSRAPTTRSPYDGGTGPIG